MNYILLQRSLFCILLLGLFNLYSIFSYGIIFSLPDEFNPSLSLDKHNLLLIIFLSVLIFLLFFKDSFNHSSDSTVEGWNLSNRNIVEFICLIGFSILGFSLLLMSKDTLFFYLSLELYSFSIYTLILIKDTPRSRRLTILYLIFNSLSSGFLLLAFSYFYFQIGNLSLQYLDLLDFNPLLASLITASFLFKLGSFPFLSWVLKFYSSLDRSLFLYLLTIPKFLFFFIFLQFCDFLHLSNQFLYSLFFLAILSLIVSSLGGLFHNTFSALLTYSSVLNFGFILLSFTIFSLSNNLDNTWLLYHFLFVYNLSLFALFFIFSFLSRSSHLARLNSFFQFPYLYFCLFIIIFSFIGFPPLGGFFAKAFLFFSYSIKDGISYSIGGTYSYSESFFQNIALFVFLFASLFSSFYYFKFLYTVGVPTPRGNPFSSIKDFTPIISSLNSTVVNFESYFISFITLLLICYSFFFPFFYPFFF